MYRKEFENILRQNKTFDAYMFYGESSFLIDYYTKEVLNQVAPNEDIQKVYFDEYNFKQCQERLLQSSLFSSNNILLIKIDKKIPKKEVTALIEACNTNPDSVVIFACLDDSDFKQMAGYFSNKTNSVSVRLFNPFPNDALQLLRREADKLNVLFDNYALNHLYNMHRQDLSLCVNDLQKLSVLGDKISTKMIDQHCFGFGTVCIDDFLQKLLLGENINKDLYFILEEGVNAIYLLSQISSFVQQLFIFNSFIKLYGHFDSKEVLGYKLPNNIENQRANLAIKFKTSDYLKILEYLNNIELELKSGKMIDSNTYLQSVLRNFSTLFR